MLTPTAAPPMRAAASPVVSYSSKGGRLIRHILLSGYIKAISQPRALLINAVLMHKQERQA